MPMSVETYLALSLDRQPELEVNGRGDADFRRSLDHPDDRVYNPCAEALSGDDVPAGQTIAVRGWSRSRIFAGTRRDIFLHRPAGVDPAAPLQLIVFNDGAGYLARRGPVRACRVLDALHAAGEIAPTLGLFINPGSRRDDDRPDWAERRLEYDPLTSDYADFLLNEIIPWIQAEHGLNLVSDPAGRAICGISSGGIAAFTAAWMRPESFGAVISHCGSFVNIDGGHVYPFLVRSTPRKPIRVFLQSGAQDGRNVYGDWPLANQTMANALAFAGYDVRFEFGVGGHTLRHGGAMFADTLRWIFQRGT